MTTPLLSIVIVNYNSAQYLSDCVESIKNTVNRSYEIIVVDNASSDNSLTYLRKQYPQIKIIANTSNRGFSSANNQGAQIAKGRYLLLLNADTKLLTNLSPALNVLEHEEWIGAIGIKMRGRKGEVRRSAGKFPNPLRLFRFSSLYYSNTLFQHTRKKQGKATNYIIVDWIEGSFILTKMSIWNNLKGMDENYFMYIEDVDFCWRIKKLGKTVIYFPEIEYVHYGGYEVNRIGYLIDGFVLFHRKHSGTLTNVIVSIILFIGIIMRYIWYRLRYAFSHDNRDKDVYQQLRMKLYGSIL